MLGSHPLPLFLLLFALVVPAAPILWERPALAVVPAAPVPWDSPARADVHACTQCGSRRTSMAVVADAGRVTLRVCRRCAKDFKAKGEQVIRLAPRCASCVRRATFGLPGNPAEHCKEHRLEGELATASKRCRHPACPRHPTYGWPGRVPVHCKEHKLENHVHLKKKSWRSCQHPEGAT